MRTHTQLLLLISTFPAFILSSGTACASAYNKSDSLYGPLGLNVVPNARINESGTIKLGTATLDPYLHTYLGLQLTDSFYVQLRQSAEISDLNDDADRLYPGIDFKLRLAKESTYRPEFSIGVQSAAGHTRMSGEYIALSKRYKAFDFTAGLGWGRFGSAGHFKNPLKALSNHFERDRALDGEAPSGIENWFTGDDVGFFAGIEYQTPLQGLSIKGDYGADRYSAERTALRYDPPSPWSLGLSYQPTSWLNIGVGAQGTDKLMARLTLNTNMKSWRNRGDYTPDKKVNFRSYRTELALNNQIEIAAKRENITLSDTTFDNTHIARTHLALNTRTAAPYQFGQAAKHMSNHAGPAVEELIITPTLNGLKGTPIKLLRKDMMRAAALKEGSADEIWQNVEFETQSKNHIENNTPRGKNDGNTPFHHTLYFDLDQQLSLSEEDTGVLNRTSLIAGFKGARLFGLFDQDMALRLNLADNLNRITDLRPRSPLPVRSDVDLFARRTLSLERSTLNFTHSFKPDLHLALMGGYLEEMYGGFGGEILYRPFKSRFAAGIELWQAFKRDPYTDLNTGFTGDRLLTGHLKAWYDIPGQDMTVGAEFGRYLAEDVGGGITLSKRFKNGVSVEGFITMTDTSDFDLFGDQTHINHGIRLNVPFGGYKYLPRNTRIKARLEPFGRDIGQKIQVGTSLYERTEPLSYAHIARHWDEITKE